MKNEEIKRNRTIVDAIKMILEKEEEGLTSKEIYNRIIQKELYDFQAREPEHIVSATIRRHCLGIDFPTASPVKHFVLVGKKNKKCFYRLVGQQDNEKDIITKIKPVQTGDECLPEERMKNAYDEHCINVKKMLLEKINESNPAFFESLVLQLLLKMGYGYDENAGTCVGSPHDGGIDGIIYEDKLGLDKIYIQAKRYAKENTVGRKEVQSFVGAMVDVQKGVFITSSKFTSEAVKYADSYQLKHIRLMDGEALVENMIKYQVGVTIAAVMNTYKIDNDYFCD